MSAWSDVTTLSLFQLTVSVDEREWEEELSEEIVLRQRGRMMLGGSADTSATTGNYYNTNFKGTIDQVSAPSSNTVLAVCHSVTKLNS